VTAPPILTVYLIFYLRYPQMKYITLLLLTITACQVNKDNAKKQDPTILHDIWALHTLQGEPYTSGMSAKHPTLEFNVVEKQVSGTDGCNRIFGGIATLTHEELVFAPLAGTRMMCPDMKIADAFNKEIGKTAYYTIKDLKLRLLDQDHNELMVFRKVD